MQGSYQENLDTIRSYVMDTLEASDMLGITPHEVTRQAVRGTLASVKVRKVILLDRDQVEEKARRKGRL